MANDINQHPIFIVGAPRSGTTLLAVMLGAHTRLSCGPETRFFRFLAKADLNLLYDSWPDNAVDFLFSIVLIDPIPEHYGFTRDEVCVYLKERPPSVRAILESLTEQFMIREVKQRWVEKSPENLMHVMDIRKFFPKSPIVRIIRDPRDAALSMVKWPHGPKDFLEALLLWCKYDNKSANFFENDNNCYTISYEDLVCAPKRELENLCTFLSESFEPQMLDTSHSANSVVTEKETWKLLVSKPLDLTRIGVWKRELTQEQNRVAEALIGDRLIAYNYDQSEEYFCTANVFPSLDLLLNYRRTLDLLVSEGIRFWRPISDDSYKMTIYVGDPDQDKWLSYQKPKRWWDTFNIISQILRHKLTRECVYWVANQETRFNLGFCGQLLDFFFHHAGKRCFES